MATAKLTDKNNLFLSPLFIVGLIIKIVLSFFCASHYLSDLFIPFINKFVLSGFQNPWEFFYGLGQTNNFPYPPVMLWIMSTARIVFIPVLSSNWEAVSALHLFVMRLPLLGFDIFLFYLLAKLLPTQHKKLLLIYWLSPIILFINYLHGQLDIIPTTIFIASILLILNKRYLFAALALGIAAGTKSHIMISLPFVLVFLYRQKLGWKNLLTFFFIFVLTYGALIVPYAFTSEAFKNMVFNSPEQQRLFSFRLAVSPTLSFLICPMIVVIVFFKFISYRKLNKEIFLMFLGFVFAALVVFVPPMPGWFLWSLPFLIYFYITNEKYSRAPFVFYNVVYFIYFLFFFEKDFPINLASMDETQISNLALSVTMASVGYIAWWMYQAGIEKNEELKIREAPFLIGIGGDSASGKHTLYNILRNLVGKDQSISIFGDNFHKWERGNENWNVYTHLHPSGNKLHDEMNAAIALKDGKSIELGEYNHDTGTFTEASNIESNKFVFFVGLHPFYLKRMRDLIQLKIFIDTDESLRRHWKITRDCKKRGYEKEKVVEQIEAREEDSEKYIQPQAQFADLVIRTEPVQAISNETPQSEEIPIKVSYILDNSLALDHLVSELLKIPTLTIRHEHEVSKQTLSVQGEVSARDIMTIAYSFNLNFDELLISKNKWLKNYNGITQLVFLLVYNDTMGAK